ncbi:MAG: hypothetical protein ACOYN4_18735, partial [Bacteroidales bacterium]
MKKSFLALVIVLTSSTIFAQNKDQGTFKTYEPGYFQNSILKGIEEFESQKVATKQTKTFKIDPSTLNIPTS